MIETTNIIYEHRYKFYLKSVPINRSFLGGTVVKNLPANSGDVGSVPGSGRSPEEGRGSPLQNSCLQNPMDRGAWQLQSTGSQS